jgi:hypothetical protein
MPASPEKPQNAMLEARQKEKSSFVGEGFKETAVRILIVLLLLGMLIFTAAMLFTALFRSGLY